jgi:hypothetical protein
VEKYRRELSWVEGGRMKKGLHYYIVIGTFALIAVADLFSALASVPWLTTRIPAFTLLVVSSMFLYLVHERGNKLDAIEYLLRNETQDNLETGIQRIIYALKGADVTLFESRKDFFGHAAQEIDKWKKIDVTHFGFSAPSAHDPDSVAYHKTFARVIKQKEIRVRRILIIRKKEHVEWARRMLNDFSDCHRFSLSVYPGHDDISMINLMIVNDHDVYIGGGERALRDDGKAMLVKHPAFTKGIEEYFQTLLEKSKEVKSVSDLEKLLKQWELPPGDFNQNK